MDFVNWAQVYDERARRYDNVLDVCEFYCEDGYCGEAWLQAATDHIADSLRLEPTDSLLEVGCGCGVLASLLLTRVGKFVGVDPAAAVLERARQRIPAANFYLASADELPFENASFEKCFSYQVLHYFESLAIAERSILEMGRVVKPGGRILLGQVPNAEWRDAYVANRRKRTFKRDETVKHSLSWLWYPPAFFEAFRDRFSAVHVNCQGPTFDPAYRFRMDVEIVV